MGIEKKLINQYLPCKGTEKYCPLIDIITNNNSINKDFLEQLNAVENYRKKLSYKGIKIDINQAYIQWVSSGQAKTWRNQYEKK